MLIAGSCLHCRTHKQGARFHKLCMGCRNCRSTRSCRSCCKDMLRLRNPTLPSLTVDTTMLSDLAVLPPLHLSSPCLAGAMPSSSSAYPTTADAAVGSTSATARSSSSGPYMGGSSGTEQRQMQAQGQGQGQSAARRPSGAVGGGVSSGSGGGRRVSASSAAGQPSSSSSRSRQGQVAGRQGARQGQGQGQGGPQYLTRAYSPGRSTSGGGTTSGGGGRGGAPLRSSSPGRSTSGGGGTSGGGAAPRPRPWRQRPVGGPDASTSPYSRTRSPSPTSGSPGHTTGYSDSDGLDQQARCVGREGRRRESSDDLEKAVGGGAGPMMGGLS